MTLNVQAMEESGCQLLSAEPPLKIQDRQKPGSKAEVFPQFCSISSGVCNGLMMGLLIGFSSVGFASFNDDPNRPFTLSDSQKGSLGSAQWLGAAIGTSISGMASSKLGRISLIRGSLLPYIVGWLMVRHASSFGVMYAGRFISGFDLGVVSVPYGTYLSETTRSKIRGRATTVLSAFFTLGALINYTISLFLAWQSMALVNAAIPLLFLPAMLYSPESPMWLLSQDRVDEARRSLQRLRGFSTNIQKEFEEMQDHIRNAETAKMSWSDILTNWTYLKPVILMIPVPFLRHFTGWGIIQSFTLDIFEDAGLQHVMNPRVGCIILGTGQLTVFFCSGYAMDKLGRKKATIFSATLMGLSQLSFALYLYLESKPELKLENKFGFFPLIALLVCMLAYSLGVGSFYFILLGEVMPQRIRSVATGLISMINTSAGFAAIQSYYSIVAAAGETTAFGIYGIVCFLLVIYAASIFPETKGRTLMDLEKQLTESKNLNCMIESVRHGGPSSPQAENPLVKGRRAPLPGSRENGSVVVSPACS
ncbi:unnamed protein product [Cyprideis torosa]|uniref:Uncharacterized protein n=1 Tax=Cyprideis torosa TaxID=163714 RepID=A0A7R8ZMS3_9CRUS|nr:unnamed protein product [Cyprideis torosa]CAG0886236.1 unnamed protein product [Cyprideis torosa]